MDLGRRLFLVDDPLFDEHRARGYHPERPERLFAARDAVAELAGTGLEVVRLPPRDASADEIGRIHRNRYVDELERHQGSFAALDDDTYLGPRSVPAAYRAAGGAVALVDRLVDAPRPGDLGLALLRPPGHHARPDRGMGFCLLNNVAIAAAHALTLGFRRVAIVDWDVHHGNGTQECFIDDPRVLFTSIHQYPFYPGTGGATDVGSGAGEGFTLNVPLSPNAGDLTYQAAFEAVVLPVLDQYAPDLVLVSAGFDAHARDPLAGMAVTAPGFGQLARGVAAIAQKHAGGRLGIVLEGGYDLEGIEQSLSATLRAAAGLEAAEVTDDEPDSDDEPGPLSQRHELEIERARRIAGKYWKL